MDQDEEELYNEDHLRAIGEETKHDYDTVWKIEKISCHSDFTSNQFWDLKTSVHFCDYP